eukprot:Hpha_TRINITY_DN16050_c2_g9::TRINITY_DN16050_c2_g9_i1::g.121515::m.121515
MLSGDLVPHYSEHATVHEKIEILRAALSKSALLAKIKREVKDEIIKPRYSAAALAQQLPQLMDQVGASVRILNHIHQLHNAAQGGLHPTSRPRGSTPPSSALPSSRDPGSSSPASVSSTGGGSAGQTLPPLPVCEESNDVIAELRRKWRTQVVARMQIMAREADVPFARLRTPQTEQQRRFRDAASDRRRLYCNATSLSQLNKRETDEGGGESDPEAGTSTQPVQ